MKPLNIVALVSVSTALLSACSKPQSRTAADATPEPTPIVQSTPEPKSIAVATPEPIAPAPAATPEPNYFAPEGIYFLTVKKSVETADGITGVRPGTRLQKQADGTFRTTEGLAVSASEFEVTNDLRVAQQLVVSDATATALLRQQMAGWSAAEATLKTKAFTPPAPTPLPPGARMTSYTTVGPDGQAYTTTTVTQGTYPHTALRRATPVPTPANALERATYGEKKIFKDRDGDGRSFEIRR